MIGILILYENYFTAGCIAIACCGLSGRPGLWLLRHAYIQEVNHQALCSCQAEQRQIQAHGPAEPSFALPSLSVHHCRGAGHEVHACCSSGHDPIYAVGARVAIVRRASSTGLIGWMVQMQSHDSTRVRFFQDVQACLYACVAPSDEGIRALRDDCFHKSLTSLFFAEHLEAKQLLSSCMWSKCSCRRRGRAS